jgi:hypothetical protein
MRACPVSGAIKIRLWGLRSECETAARHIAAALPVVSISEPRADRGQSSLVRVYIEARLPLADGQMAAPGSVSRLRQQQAGRITGHGSDRGPATGRQ